MTAPIKMYGCQIGRAQLSPAWCDLYPGQPGWMLLSDFIFSAKGAVYRIPHGFWYNGASVPMLFWQLVCSPHDPRIIERALIHDWLYTTKILPRADADALLVAELDGMGAVRKASIKAAVRAFGGAIAWPDSPADRKYLTELAQAIAASGREFSSYLMAV